MKCFIAFLLFATGLAADAQPVKSHGALAVDSTRLVDSKGVPVVLRGMSFGWHNFWPRFYNAGAVQWLSEDWHCSVIRAAMGVEPAGGYLQDPKASVEKIRAVVDAAIAQDVYVIIDWHSHNINLEAAREFFTAMAKEYGAYPHVIYELFNEPDEESWAEVKAYATTLIRAIREIDPDNLILVGTPHWDQDVHLAADDPIRGFSNIMYTMHFYAGTHRQWLRDRCDAALAKGLPLFISESAGMEATGDGPIDAAEWQRWISWAEKRRISWITWSVSDKDETCSVLRKSAASNGGWKASDLKTSGAQTRALLRKYHAAGGR